MVARTLAETLLRRVRHHIQEENLLTPGPLVVAVSGGPDSLCLLHLLWQLKDALGLRLHVAHLDHGLRGAEGEADARFVTGLAQDWGLPSTVERRDVPAFREAARLSLEAAAREVRYSFLAEVARRVGTERVALGHTADDQVETILLHLLRGTGLAGLRGMLPSVTWRRGDGPPLTLVRPLLGVSRAETEAYCAVVGLVPRQDSSNLEPGPLRNRLRLDPLLRTPGLGQALLNLAQMARDEVAYLDREVAARWGSVVREEAGGLALDVAAFAVLPPALQRHLLRRALSETYREAQRGALRDIAFRHIEALREALARPHPGKQVPLPRGLVFSLDYGKGILRKEALAEGPRLEREYVLTAPGEMTIPGWLVRAEVTAAGGAGGSGSPWRASLDADRVGQRLWVRARRPGDLFQPLGLARPKKLQDFLVDAKVPRSQRDALPLVCGEGGILWVVGWRIAETARITEATRRALSLEFVPQEGGP